MANDKLLVAELYPVVATNLVDDKCKEIIYKGVSKYIDRNIDIFSMQGPTTRPIFGEVDKQIIYSSTGLSNEGVRSAIKSNEIIKDRWKVLNNEPFIIAAVLATRYAAITKDTKLEKTMVTYLTLGLYPSIHFKYFKFKPQQSIMDYVISEMSNKYKVKTAGTILKALTETTEKCYEHHRKAIIEGTDQGMVKYVMDMRTRINSLIKNIRRAYGVAHEQGQYLNADSNSFEEDNYRETDNDMYAVERISNNVTLKLMTQGPDSSTVTMAAQLCKVSVNELRNYTNSLINGDKREEVKSIIEAIITTYISDGNKADEISRNNRFLVHANNLYKKSNTSDVNIIRIKKILDTWIDDIDIYKKTQRAATINDFRRALYMFMVITIMKTA